MPSEEARKLIERLESTGWFKVNPEWAGKLAQIIDDAMQPKWIRVADVPPYDTEILARHESGAIVHLRYWAVNWAYLVRGLGNEGQGPITHYMLAPPPAKED